MKRLMLMILCVCAGLVFGIPGVSSYAQVGQSATSAAEPQSDKSTRPPAQAPEQGPDARQSLDNVAATVSRLVVGNPIPSAIAAMALLAAAGVLLAFASRSPTAPYIRKLGPSFFFWLGMVYMGLLVLMALAYTVWYGASPAYLIGDVLPIAVPWFGALGAVAISLEGIFEWNKQWNDKYNYWHIGRPLFGAVLGAVAFFLYVLIITASGTPPKFLEDPSAATAKDFIIFYMVAFLVGYREQTFRELIKRVTDLVFKADTQAAGAPAASFKIAGATPLVVGLPATAAKSTSRVTVEVQNVGAIPLVSPVVAVSPDPTIPTGTFGTENDQVTGGTDLAPSQSRMVDVTFTPSAAGFFSATLSLAAKNLPTPATIPIAGTGQ